MQSCSPAADTETCSICRPTRAAAMSQRHIALTKEARSSPIHHSHRLIRLHPRQRRLSVKLTLMSESLRKDGRVWVPKRKEDRLSRR